MDTCQSTFQHYCKTLKHLVVLSGILAFGEAGLAALQDVFSVAGLGQRGHVGLHHTTG